MEALNHVLKRAGFESFFFHANRGNFFGRNTAYGRRKFDRFCDARCFEGDAAGWNSRDRAFFEQSVALLRERRGPGSRLFGYFVTMQSHGPFRNYDDATAEELATELSGFAGFSRLQRDYMCSMREIDRAVEHFFASIHTAGLDDALVVLFADHTSGVMNGVENRIEQVPLLIHYPGVEPRRLDAVGSLLDVAPTVAQLLGLDPGATWIGDSLYQGDGRVVVFADGTVLRGTPDRLEQSRASQQQRRFLQYSRYLQR
jgi:phosphoglycerol transferase MdoB-like AlkP superfamily enzyme